MSDLETKNDALNQAALIESVNEASDQYKPSVDFEAFIKKVGEKFIEKKIDQFPMLCEIARVQNTIKMKELQENGYKGKYTDSYGWSKDGNFKFKYEVPRDLYLFMCNLVYKEFWSADNDKISTKFMEKVVKGDDPMEILMWVKTIYGPNTTNVIV